MSEAKTAVITGASSGLGQATAKALAAQGWHVIAHGRDPERTAAAEADIRSTAKGRVDMIRGDLSLMSETARMADAIAALTPQVYALINNAGGMRSERIITAEGNEVSFAGNHLGHFLLTKRLMPQLRQAAAASARGTVRVINVSSDGHTYCPGIDWDDLQLINNWDSGKVYCLVKLYNVLFTRELARRYAADGIIAHALHPGTIDSNFVNHAVASTKAYMQTLNLVDPAIAAEPLIWLAASFEAGQANGLYYEKFAATDPAPLARDDANAVRLWEESEALLAKAGY
jgi:NAD(P)-dependent dehydrogenase (short-subunit alcohol dehydrogenase family)